MWRLSTSDARNGTTTGWITLSEDDAKPTGELQRDAVTSGSTTWMAEQEPLSTWANVDDGVFYDPLVGANRMVGAGPIGFWSFLDTTSTSFDGYNGGYDEDPDVATTFIDNAGDAGSTTFQGTVVNGLAFDVNGRAHAAVSDIGYYHEDDGATERAYVPCQTEAFNAGGRAVSVSDAADGTSAVWIALTEQSSTGGAPPSNVGVVRGAWDSALMDYEWCYQGAQNSYARELDASDDMWVGCKYDWLYYSDTDPATVASLTTAEGDWIACDAAAGVAASDQGLEFRESSGSYSFSWGNPLDLVAFDENMAVATFQSYTYTKDLAGYATSGTWPGRVAYTVDGGVTWTEIAFDASSDASCSAISSLQYDFFLNDAQLALDHVSGSTWWTSGTDWGLSFFVLAGDTNGSLTTAGKSCSLWRVAVDAAGAGAGWSNLDFDYDAAGCKLNSNTADGVAVSPWSERVVVWGGYSRFTNGSTDASQHGYGGACFMNFDGTNKLRVLDPDLSANWFAVKDMAPHPYVVDTWFVTPHVDAEAQSQCIRERASDGAGGYVWDNDWASVYSACAEPVPFILQRRPPASPGWMVVDLPITGLDTLRGTEMATAYGDGWTVIGGPVGVELEQLLYGTNGSGVYRGILSW